MNDRIKHKVDMKLCRAKKHTFIPITWRMSTTTRSVTEFACSSCLVTIERRDVEVFNQQINREVDASSRKEAEGK